MLNKSFECVPIHSSFVDTTCEITIYIHCRQNAEVLALLCTYFARDFVTFLAPSMCTISTGHIDISVSPYSLALSKIASELGENLGTREIHQALGENRWN